LLIEQRVLDEAIDIYRHLENAVPFLYHKENAPCYSNNHKEWVSFAAIAEYINPMQAQKTEQINSDSSPQET